MRFTKMHGAGNDFVIIRDDDEHYTPEALSALAVKLCTRRTGIGADGMMVVVPARNGGDYRMLFYNADGTPGEMCGNGARCIARYGYENRLAGTAQRIETTAGLVTGQRLGETEYRIRLNDPSVLEIERKAHACGHNWGCGYAELGAPGIPHALLELDFEGMKEDELRCLGRELRYAAAFPKGANVTFWKELSPGHVKVRTYERGVEDFTLACGTGCGSLTAVLTAAGRCSGELRLDCPGGTLRVSLQYQNGGVSDIFLSGPTCIVAEGETVE